MSEFNPTTDEVLEQIPEDNIFREVVAALRKDGQSWGEIFNEMDAAHQPVDRAAYKDSFFEVPRFEATVIDWDENATSGERRDRIEVEAVERDESPADVAERLEADHRRVENVEQTGTEWVS